MSVQSHCRLREMSPHDAYNECRRTSLTLFSITNSASNRVPASQRPGNREKKNQFIRNPESGAREATDTRFPLNSETKGTKMQATRSTRFQLTHEACRQLLLHGIRNNCLSVPVCVFANRLIREPGFYILLPCCKALLSVSLSLSFPATSPPSPTCTWSTWSSCESPML